ncbi:MAG: AI-2E family transporter [Gammaproteobacteria bacterium]|nr:AI-2E family transporter [Gammaproteobacteria bacterium]
MNENSAQRIFFGVLLIAVTAAFIWLIRGFVQPIFWAVALGIVFFPLHQMLEKRLNGRRSLAATLSTIAILLIVVLPIAAIAAAVAGEAANLYQRIQNNDINVSGAVDWAQQQLPLVVEGAERLGVDLDGLRSQLSSSAVTVSQFIATRAVAIGQDTIRITVYFFLMLYLLYFFMRDGTKMLDGLVRALPLGDERERHLLERFAEVSRATIKGTLVVGIVQGTIGGILFAVLGLGAPVLWGVVMALLSIIPAVGPALIWLPAAIFLIVNGQIIQGIVLIVGGSLVVGLADNLLRPLLVGRDTRMPDYLILLSTLGGLTAFGIAGIVIGPIIAAFFLSVWEMAEDEYADIDPPTDQGDGSPNGGAADD